MEGDRDRKTPGDIAGEAARAKSGVTEAQAPARPRTQLEEKIFAWGNSCIETCFAAAIFAFFEQYPAAVLEVYDKDTPGADIGRLRVIGGQMCVMKGNRKINISWSHNDRRFVPTPKCAEMLGTFEYRRDLGEAMAAERAHTRGFIRTRIAEVVRLPEASENPGESKFGTRLQEIIDLKANGADSYVCRIRGRKDVIEYVFFKCSETDRETLKEYAKNEGLPQIDDKDTVEILVENVPGEKEFVKVLKKYGYKAEYCFPARIRIDSFGIKFYPAAGEI